MIGNVTVTNQHVSTLYSLLSLSISEMLVSKPSRPRILSYNTTQTEILQHPQITCYLHPSHSTLFAHLNLFTSSSADPEVSPRDVHSRRIQWSSNYLKPFIASRYR